MPSAKVVAANGQLLIDSNDGYGTRWAVADNEPQRASFSLFIPSFVPAANATDILTIQGSPSGKIARIRQIIVTGTATSAQNINVLLTRRTTANTGGTFTVQTLVPRDNTDNAPTCVVNLYTANPTGLGTAIGVADGGRLNVAPASNGSIDRLILQYGWYNDKAPILRGTSDFLCVGLNGGTIPNGCNLDINIVLTED